MRKVLLGIFLISFGFAARAEPVTIAALEQARVEAQAEAPPAQASPVFSQVDKGVRARLPEVVARAAKTRRGL